MSLDKDSNMFTPEQINSLVKFVNDPLAQMAISANLDDRLKAWQNTSYSLEDLKLIVEKALGVEDLKKAVGRKSKPESVMSACIQLLAEKKVVVPPPSWKDPSPSAPVDETKQLLSDILRQLQAKKADTPANSASDDGKEGKREEQSRKRARDDESWAFCPKCSQAWKEGAPCCLNPSCYFNPAAKRAKTDDDEASSSSNSSSNSSNSSGMKQSALFSPERKRKTIIEKKSFAPLALFVPDRVRDELSCQELSQAIEHSMDETKAPLLPNFVQWTIAFNNYSLEYCRLYPSELQDLVAYAGHISLMAARWSYSIAAEADIRFRRHIADKKSNFRDIDVRIQAEFDSRGAVQRALEAKSGSPKTGDKPNFSRRARQQDQDRNKKSRNSKGTCNEWNKGNACDGKCNYEHKCRHCRGDHRGTEHGKQDSGTGRGSARGKDRQDKQGSA
jgi:hypothetical protein